MTRMILFATLLFSLGAIAQYQVQKQDLYSALIERTKYVGNKYYRYTQVVSPWKNWIVELIEYENKGGGPGDSAEIRLFPTSDTNNITKLITLHPIHSDIFNVNLRSDWGINKPVWSILQDQVTFYAAGSEINTIYDTTVMIPGEFFSIDVSSLTLVTIAGVHFTEIPISLLQKRNVPQPKILTSNKPNPFSYSTSIEYSIPAANSVSILIFDLSGSLIKAIHREHHKSGTFSTFWDGKNNLGKKMSIGQYYYQVISGDYISSKKMTCLR